MNTQSNIEEDSDADLVQYSHDLVEELERVEGQEREDIEDDEDGGGNENDIDFEDEDDDDEISGKRRTLAKKKKKAPSPPPKQTPLPSTDAIPKKGRGKKKETAPSEKAATPTPVTWSPEIPPPPPRMPNSGPDAQTLETDISTIRRWIQETLNAIDRSLSNPESITEIRTRRVMAQYADTLRKMAIMLALIGTRYEEMHRVFIAHSYDARQRESFGVRRGAGSFSVFGK